MRSTPQDDEADDEAIAAHKVLSAQATQMTRNEHRAVNPL